MKKLFNISYTKENENGVRHEYLGAYHTSNDILLTANGVIYRFNAEHPGCRITCIEEVKPSAIISELRMIAKECVRGNDVFTQYDAETIEHAIALLEVLAEEE